MEEVKEVELNQDVAAAAQRVMRISPSKRRVLEMTDDLLLSNYALIAHKASSLSSAQRNLVAARVAYGVRGGRITVDQVANAVNNLTKMIEEELGESIINADDSSNN